MEKQMGTTIMVFRDYHTGPRLRTPVIFARRGDGPRKTGTVASAEQMSQPQSVSVTSRVAPPGLRT